MNAIIRGRESVPSIWGPFPDFENLFGNFRRSGLRANFADTGAIVPAMDIRETEMDYQITADLPGISKDELEVSVRDSVLTISAETRKESTEESDGRVVRQERQVGRFVRSLRLSDVVNDAEIQAKYEDGVLKLTLPKKEAATPRKIEVSVN